MVNHSAVTASIQTMLNMQRVHDKRFATTINGHWSYEIIDKLNIMTKEIMDVEYNFTPIFGTDSLSLRTWYNGIEAKVSEQDRYSLYVPSSEPDWSSADFRAIEQLVMLWRHRVKGLPEEFGQAFDEAAASEEAGQDSGSYSIVKVDQSIVRQPHYNELVFHNAIRSCHLPRSLTGSCVPWAVIRNDVVGVFSVNNSRTDIDGCVIYTTPKKPDGSTVIVILGLFCNSGDTHDTIYALFDKISMRGITSWVFNPHTHTTSRDIEILTKMGFTRDPKTNQCTYN